MDRLRQLAQQGDRDAARELRRQARRQHDPEALCCAALALGDVAALGELAEAAWRAGDMTTATTHMAAMGYTLTPAQATGLERLLDAVNGKRRARTLALGAVLATVGEVRLGQRPFAWRHGGEGKDGSQQTSFCLVARRSDGHLCLGLALAGALRTSPGRAWEVLQLWVGNAPERNAPRVLAWADAAPAADRIVIDQLVEPTAAAPEPWRVRTLSALLSEAPDTAVFGKITRLLDAWPDDEARDVALERARRALTTWPVECRAAGVGWWRRVVKGTPRPSDDLVETLIVSSLRGQSEYERLLASPALERLRGLDLHGPRPPGLLDVAARSPHLHTLRMLDLGNDRATMAGGLASLAEVAAVLAAPGLARLETLHLGGVRAAHRDRTETRVADLSTYALTSLRTLDLRGNRLAGDELAALVSAPAIAALRTLVLRDAALDATGYEALATAEHLANLEHLDLRRARGIDTGAAAILASQNLTALTTLDLSGAGPTAVAKLAGCTLLPGLQSLVLDHLADGCGDDVLHTLADAPASRRLTRLSLRASGITRHGVRALHEDTTGLGALETLDLRGNDTLDADDRRRARRWGTARGVEVLTGR